MAESFLLSYAAIRLELLGSDVCLQGIMLPCGLQVLTNGHDSAAGFQQVIHCQENFIVCLPGSRG